MKKTFLLSLILVLSVSLAAQRVSRDKVVLEIATGTWCPYCPGAAMGADELIENGHDVAVIEYHNGDPYANVYSNARNAYYNVSGYPTAHFDGLNPYVGGSSTQSLYGPYLSRVNQRLAIPSDFTIDVSGEHMGLSEWDITVDVEKVSTYNGTNLRLHAVITESHIEDSWQGMDELNFVCRLMVPNQNGTAISFSGGNTIQEELQFTIDEEWDPVHCELVVFIQDNSTKEILQGTKMALLNFPSAFDSEVATLEIGNIPETTCSGSFEPSVIIRNQGNDPLTSLDIAYNVNEGDSEIYQWTGSVEYLDSLEVTLPAINFTVLEENSLVVASENPNQAPDPYPSNDDKEQMVEQGDITPSTINLILRTDANPTETTWEIVDSEGEVLYSGGPYSNSGEMIMEEFELADPDCYSFNIYDAGGDGLMQPGFYSLYYDNNTTIAQGTSFGSMEATEFTADDGVGIDESGLPGSLKVFPNPTTGKATLEFFTEEQGKVTIEVYSASGERAISLTDERDPGTHRVSIDLGGNTSGIYFVKVISGNKIVTKRISLL